MAPAIGHKSLLPLILSIAFLARLGAAITVQSYLAQPGRSFLIEGDANGYWMLGMRLAEGQTYAVHDPPRRVMRMPGFPLLLALPLRLFGENFFAARIWLAAVGTACCLLVYQLGKELIGDQCGLIAAALAALSPTFVGFSVLVLSETAFAAGILASLVMLARLAKSLGGGALRHQLWLALAAGCSIMLASYVRPTWLLAGPVAAALICLAVRLRRGLLLGGVLLLGLAATLAPWVVRNHRVTGHWVATTLWVGPSLYDGLNPQATGDSDMTFFERDQLLARMSEYEMDRHYRRAALQFVRDHPLRTLQLAGEKLLRYWSPVPNAVQFRSWPLTLAVACFSVPLLLSALAGCWVLRRRWWVCLLAAGPIIAFAMVHAVFVGSLRYRLPAEYPLCVLSAVGLQWFASLAGITHYQPDRG